ncbi:class I adenylate-forming enzyme family protein [Halomarina ordinaria]|uniref:Class I adenylate-forming enzyme family protein n=1 Tax=Halomarina ordinaria TaxID=3033939 RepID=A0ABD5UB47_9EURY|nr:class I adenylate-forming enzyme family protein [Halomarina sp. PSRA2]
MYQRILLRQVRDWLGHRSRVTPDAAALVDTASGASLTFADLDAEVEALAGRLAAEGVCVDDHVGMLLDASPTAVTVVHAAMRVGGVLVPLSTRLTTAELEPRIERADLDVLVCEAGTEARALDAAGDVRVVSVDADGEAAAIGATDPQPFDLPEWDADDPLAMLYTSGTTGAPKLVVLTVMNVLSSASASAFRLGTLPDDRWASPLSMSSMGGLAPLYRTTLYGTALVLCPTDPDDLLEALGDQRPTGVSLVPTLLARLLEEGDLPDSLRFVLLGGAPAPDDLVRECGERGVPVCPTYGMTETASQVATARPGEAPAHVGTVGRPLLFTEVTVVDDHGDPLPRGHGGELVVAGPTVTAGYYDDPAATAEAFCPHGLLTGDVGRVDAEGRLWVGDRKADRIITGGQNVDPNEVVAALRSLEGVRDAAVVGLPDEEWGERVAALVETENGLDESSVEAHCRERLAGYKLPRVVGFGPLPRTESGTVDRAAVRERLEAVRATTDS